MMLQIEVFENDRLLPSETHFATLVNSKDGQVWSLGRKQGTFMAKDDRSVSRLHMTLSIVSANKTHLDSSHPPKACSTPDQVEACKVSKDRMCVVAQNLGKLGSFAIRDRSAAPSVQPARDDDDSDTADEDEVIATQSQTAMAADVVMSSISQKLVPGGTIKSILANETLVLHELNAEDDEGDDQSSSRRAVLQCGKLGTTVVITRHHLALTPSGKAKQQLHDIADLFAIGASIVDQVTAGDYHYLVTDQYTASTSQLTAWSLGVPLVDVGFVQALLDRKAATDPLPQVTNYVPETDSNDFWKTPSNQRLWESCTLLSIHPTGSDLEHLVKAAGAQIINLHKDKKFLKDKEVLQILETAENPFAILDNKRKITKLLKKHNIPLIRDRDIATAITKQRLLVDGDGNPIGTESKAAQDAGGDVDKKPEASAEEAKLAPREVIAAGDDKAEKHSVHEEETRAPRSEQVEQDPSPEKEAPVDKNPADDVPKKKRGRDLEEKVLEKGRKELPVKEKEVEPKPSKKVRTPTPKQKKSSREKKSTSEDVAMEIIPEDMPIDDGTNDAEVVEASEKVPNEETEPPVVQEPIKPRKGKRKELEKGSKGGWLSALPQGEKRRDYIRNKDEIMEMTGLEVVADAATTEIVKNFAPPPEKQRAAEKRTGKDFKAFRKNTVPRPPTGNVEFRTVMAKESERLAHVEQERQEIEELQRRADELFRDAAPARVSGRSGRSRR